MQKLNACSHRHEAVIAFAVLLLLNCVATTILGQTGYSQSRPFYPRGTPEPAKNVKKATQVQGLVRPEFVTIPASVLTSDTSMVLNLARADFEVFLGTDRGEVVSVDKVTGPLHIAILIDSSPSDVPHGDKIKTVAGRLFDSLRPEDKVTVVSMSTKADILARATTDRVVLNKAIKNISWQGGTALYDALVDVVAANAKDHPLTAIVLFSDGADLSSKNADFVAAMEALEKSGIRVFSVFLEIDTQNVEVRVQARGQPGVSTSAPPYLVDALRGPTQKFARDRAQRGRGFLTDLLAATGGRVIPFKDLVAGKTDALDSIPYELLNQYYLRVRVPTTVTDRRSPVTVRVLKPDLLVFAQGSIVF